MICPECGAAMRRTDERIVDHYRGVEVMVDGIDHFVCDECEETAFPKKSMSQYVDAVHKEYRGKTGLLSPAEIRGTREKYGLTQREFQQVIGVKDPTVSRWETGKVVQDEVADNLIRVVRDHECVARDLMERHEVGGAGMKLDGCYAVFSSFMVGKPGRTLEIDFEEVLSE